MTRRRARHDMIDRSETAENMLPKLANDPTENAESAEPTDPMDNTEPMHPMDSTEPFDAMLRTESVDRTDQREPSAFDINPAFRVRGEPDLTGR
jgi:hypothetical protein